MSYTLEIINQQGQVISSQHARDYSRLVLALGSHQSYLRNNPAAHHVRVYFAKSAHAINFYSLGGIPRQPETLFTPDDLARWREWQDAVKAAPLLMARPYDPEQLVCVAWQNNNWDFLRVKTFSNFGQQDVYHIEVQQHPQVYANIIQRDGIPTYAVYHTHLRLF